jgi:hypothetical protein
MVLFLKIFLSLLKILTAAGSSLLTLYWTQILRPEMFILLDWVLKYLHVPTQCFAHRDNISSDNSHHVSLRTFRVTAGSAALVDIPICRESASTGFSSIYRSYITFLLSTLKECVGNPFSSASREALLPTQMLFFTCLCSAWFCESNEQKNSEKRQTTTVCPIV